MRGKVLWPFDGACKSLLGQGMRRASRKSGPPSYETDRSEMEILGGYGGSISIGALGYLRKQLICMLFFV